MSQLIINGELYHYGVKGMKWGVRKEYEAVGGLRYLHKNRGAIKEKYNRWIQNPENKKKQDKAITAAVIASIVAVGVGVAKKYNDVYVNGITEADLADVWRISDREIQQAIDQGRMVYPISDITDLIIRR